MSKPARTPGHPQRGVALVTAAALMAVLAVVAFMIAVRHPPAARPRPIATSTSTSTSTSSAGPSTGTSTSSSRRTATAGRPTTTSAPRCTTSGVLATWSLTQLAAQTLVVPVDQSAVAAITPQVAAGAGGVILFGSSAPAELASALAALKAAAPDGIPPLVMTDEEGGAVQRMPNVVGTLPSARQMGATMTPSAITGLAAEAGRRLYAVGVTMDLAPVLDLDAGPGPDAQHAIGTRSFGADPGAAASHGLAFAAGLAQGGVVAVVKHFPGLDGAGNTDLGPAPTQPWSTLQMGGLLPFEQAVQAGIPAIMVSNASVPGLTSLPASLSAPAITGVLRDQLHFGGLVLTDSLSAGAISAAGYDVPTAAVAALRAGADMVLFNASVASVPTLTAQVVQAVVAAVAAGTLARDRLQEAAKHVLRAKRVDLCL